MNKIKIKLHMDLMGYTKGRVIEIDAKDGMPAEKYWRDRLRDSEFDGCIELVKPLKKPNKKSNQETDK